MKQPIPKFFGVKRKSTIDFVDHERESMRRWISTFKDGTKLDVIIRKHSSKRSNEQNAYYWGVVIPILADYFGHDNPEDMHEDLKLKFNPVQSKLNPEITIGGTTTKMSTVDFYSADDSYVERICRWAAGEYQIYIPPPKRVEDPKPTR